MRPHDAYRADDWRAKVGVPVLLYVVHGNAEFEADKAKREREWEAWCVGYWTDHNGGGWVWHGLSGIVTHVAELPARPNLQEPPMFNTAALRALCSPDAEAMAEKPRIDMMVDIGHQAADEIDRLRSALTVVQGWYAGNTVRSNKALRPMVEIVDEALNPK